MNPPKRPIRRGDVDPDPVGAVLDQLAAAKGWSQGLAIAKLKERWEEIVGPILVSRCEPATLGDDHLLVVHCDHGATANEITLLAATLIAKANELVPGAALTAVTSKVRSRRKR